MFRAATTITTTLFHGRALTPSVRQVVRMSTASEKHTFLVYAPDKTDTDALQRRLSVRQQHLDNAKKLSAEGLLITGGAMVTEETLAAAQKHMTGSMLLIKASNGAEARQLVEKDIYYTAGVWDPEQLKITPFVLPNQNPS